MTFYQKKIKEVREDIYSNEGQIETVIGIRNYIDKNYQQPLNLDVLSNEKFVSKFHLLRTFKKYYGQTPKQFLIDTRIQKAKEHLKKGATVTETCFSVGFESVSSFSSLFKSRTGRSPSQFQKEQVSINK